MQQQYGNRYVNQVVQQAREQSRSPSQPFLIQPKLTIGAVDDCYEQQADDIAARVVEQVNTPVIGPGEDNNQREFSEATPIQLLAQRLPQSTAIVEGEASDALEASIQQARGKGQPLDASLQQAMGQAIGSDFRNVRIHTNATSDQLNRSIQAKAFTTGSDVFFRQGAYQPRSREGQALIAHELTHVAQQRAAKAGAASSIQRTISHTFGGEAVPVKWTGTAVELYLKLNQWLIDNLADAEVQALKNKWDNKSKSEIIGTIKDMMTNRGKASNHLREFVHLSTALTRRSHTFINEENAIRKILAEGYREQATKKEGDLAQQVIDSDIVTRLKSVATKVQAWPLYQKYKAQVKGEYTYYARKGWYKGGMLRQVEIDKVLSSSNDFKKLISALHDVTTFLYDFEADAALIKKWTSIIEQLNKDIEQLSDEYRSALSDNNRVLAENIHKRWTEKYNLAEFYDKKRQALENEENQAHNAVKAPDDKSVSSYSYTPARIEVIDQVRPEVPIPGTDKSYSYIDETSEVMKKVRQSELLVEVGPSYTTARLMQLCETVGCDDDEKIAVALAIFAFWNKNYWKSASGIHRFHFVMDMCKNYVPSLNYDFAYPAQITDLLTP
ncbi:DUF4157 domain-containing protein [Nodosilinea sp. FACHB-131]|nr:DUF4157 domain-containing protein [Nodosilinea sp. FACHB-131]